jgi:hypothetical protein
MNSFLDCYPLDKACNDIAGLDIYTNPYDQVHFSEVVVKYLRHKWRSEDGVDILSFITKDQAAEFCRLALSQHNKLDNDMAFIVVTAALRIEINHLRQK